VTDALVTPDTRTRIVEVAAGLLRDEGPAAVTTRGVAQAAGVQAPAIYRLFGDKDGLLEAVAEHVMSSFVAAKASVVEAATQADVDPVDDLRDGWRSQVAFGLDNPALFALLSDPGRVAGSPAARRGRAVLEARVHRVAVAGRLRVSEERAVGLVQTSGVGVITTLLGTPVDDRDPGLAEAALDGLLAQILTDAPVADPTGHLATVVAFRAVAPELGRLSGSERRLLAEWLDRVVDDRR
jgi:AcrR family transcriptional regulator